jgi:hypothetical protein
MTNTKMITPARFYAIVSASKRTDGAARDASAYVRSTVAGSRLARAMWVDTRVAVDGLSTVDAASESGVTKGRVSQIRAGIRAFRDAGITLPTDAASADALSDLYAHVSAVYKMDSKSLADAVKRAAALSDQDAKHAVFAALVLPERKRAARPGGSKRKSDASADDSAASADDSADVVTDARTPRQRAEDGIRNALATVPRLSATDAASVLALVDSLSDALAARANVTDVTDAAPSKRKRAASK